MSDTYLARPRRRQVPVADLDAGTVETIEVARVDVSGETIIIECGACALVLTIEDAATLAALIERAVRGTKEGKA